MMQGCGMMGGMMQRGGMGMTPSAENRKENSPQWNIHIIEML